MRVFAFSLLSVLFAALPLAAGVDEDWNYILALDAGPKKKPATREEAALAARNHLYLQRKAIERFLLNHPRDARVFDAKLRLARVVAAEGKMSNDQAKVDEALELFGGPRKVSWRSARKACRCRLLARIALDAKPTGWPRANAGLDRPGRAEFYCQISWGPSRSTPSCRSGDRLRRRAEPEARSSRGSVAAYRRRATQTANLLTICAALICWEKPLN